MWILSLNWASFNLIVSLNYNNNILVPLFKSSAFTDYHHTPKAGFETFGKKGPHVTNNLIYSFENFISFLHSYYSVYHFLCSNRSYIIYCVLSLFVHWITPPGLSTSLI